MICTHTCQGSGSLFDYITGSGGGSMQKVGGLKYLAPYINVYVLMIFTAFSLKSEGALAPPAPPPIPPPM